MAFFQCLNFNLGLDFASRSIARSEEKGLGRHWSDLDTPLSELTDLTFGYVLGMFWVDALIYFTIAWYIENVFPGEYGLPKPWYFCVTCDYWLPSMKKRLVVDPASNVELGSDVEVRMESEPKDLPLGVSVQNLSKVYKNGKVAVENLSVNFYEGQLTSFLGHNGAGKTTTL